MQDMDLKMLKDESYSPLIRPISVYESLALTSGLEVPTKEMITFFLKKTLLHKKRVSACLEVFSKLLKSSLVLSERSKSHDNSKFGDEEVIPYIWLTHIHRHCYQSGKNQMITGRMKEAISMAIDHHTSINRHHPEYHIDPNEMSEEDILEMVSDWTAVSIEHRQNNGSCKFWAEENIKRFRFNTRSKKLIFDLIDMIDKARKEGVKRSFAGQVSFR